MEWVNSEVAWETHAIAAEVAHQMFEAGRLCHRATCSARSEVGFEIERHGRRWEVGFCLTHAIRFACIYWRVIVGRPRRLDDTDILHGPLAGEEEGEVDDR